jgi:uncharacterized SAM-binding protein YcdF (DUF218 family)
VTRPPRRRRRLAWGAAVTASIAGLALLAREAPARRLVVADPLTTSDVIVVMAGDPDYERTTTAAALMRAGRARILILTGGEPGPGDSAASLRDRALELGVPPGRIQVETTSRSTREAVVAVAPMIEALGARTVTLVTSPYHQRRAAAAARRAWPGLVVRSHPASPSSWKAEGWWRSRQGRHIVATEYLKLVYYRCRGWV